MTELMSLPCRAKVSRCCGILGSFFCGKIVIRNTTTRCSTRNRFSERFPLCFALHHGRRRGDGEPTYDLEALIALTLRSNACIGVEAAASVDVLCSSLLEEADRS